MFGRRTKGDWVAKKGARHLLLLQHFGTHRQPQPPPLHLDLQTDVSTRKQRLPVGPQPTLHMDRPPAPHGRVNDVALPLRQTSDLVPHVEWSQVRCVDDHGLRPERTRWHGGIVQCLAHHGHHGHHGSHGHHCSHGPHGQQSNAFVFVVRPPPLQQQQWGGRARGVVAHSF